MRGRRRVTLLELTQQVNRIRGRYPEFNATIRGTRDGPLLLVAHGPLRPTSISTEYAVRLEYDGSSRPHVFVVNPQLKPRSEGEKVPHVWGPDEPCLHHERWKVGRPVADTIIPWTMLWLTFYESWRVTGVWQGGGVDHGSSAEAK